MWLISPTIRTALWLSWRELISKIVTTYRHSKLVFYCVTQWDSPYYQFYTFPIEIHAPENKESDGNQTQVYSRTIRESMPPKLDFFENTIGLFPIISCQVRFIISHRCWGTLTQQSFFKLILLIASPIPLITERPRSISWSHHFRSTSFSLHWHMNNHVLKGLLFS